MYNTYNHATLTQAIQQGLVRTHTQIKTLSIQNSIQIRNKYEPICTNMHEHLQGVQIFINMYKYMKNK